MMPIDSPRFRLCRPRLLASSSRHRQQGFSLVELMVGMAISLLVVLCASGLFVAQKASQRLSEQSMRPAQDARWTIDLLSRDARSAGDYGCAKSTVTNNGLNNPNVVGFSQRVRGFSYTAGSGLALDTTVPGASLVQSLNPTSDAVAFFGIYDGFSSLTTAMSSTSDALTVNNASSFSQTDPVVVSDCLLSDVFEISSISGSTLTHGAGSTTGLGQGNTSATLSKAYGIGSEVGRLDTIWYVMAAPTGQPAGLYRVSAARNSSALISPLATALHFSYGVDTTGSGQPSSTVQASAVSDWSTVVSLNYDLLLRSQSLNAVPSPMTYYYNGAQVTATDRAYYVPTDSSVRLRNSP